jgi:hypothetical protein
MTPIARLGRRSRLLLLAGATLLLLVPVLVVTLVSGDDPGAETDDVADGGDRVSPDGTGRPSGAPGCDEGGEVAACEKSTDTATAPPLTDAPTTVGAAPPPAAPAPSAGGFPTAATTGVPAGWQPVSVHEGDLWVHDAGTVIEDVLVTGSIQVRAENVTIKRTRVEGIIWNQYSDTEQFGGLLIEDVEVGPDSGVMTDWGHGAVGTAGYTARRVEIHNVTDGFRVSGDDIVIEDSFVTLAVVEGECNHLDAVQGYGGGDNVVVRHNTLDARGHCSNASVFMADSSPHAVVENNLLLGGTYVLRLNQFEIPATFVARGNRIVDGSWQYGAMDIVDQGALNFTCGDNQVVTIDDNYQVTGVVSEIPCP